MTGPIRGERVKKTPDKFKDIKDQYTFDPDQKQNAAKKGVRYPKLLDQKCQC